MMALNHFVIKNGLYFYGSNRKIPVGMSGSWTESKTIAWLFVVAA